MDDPGADKDGTTTHFGYEDVPVGEKTARVRAVFDSVAKRYDLMNDLMSAGVHRLWKAEFVDRLNPQPGMEIVDVAGGTGDIAWRILERCPDARVTLCDINQSMLEAGRERAFDQGRDAGNGTLKLVCGNGETLPFEDNSFDAFTIAFGLRNITHIDRALAEARRALRPGGHFLCLEFSRVVVPLLSELYESYSFTVLPALGALVARDRESYVYLAESIRKFPPQDALVEMLRAADFDQVSYANLSGGIAAIHSAWRI